MVDETVNKTIETKEKVVAPDLSLEKKNLTNLQTKVETENLKTEVVDSSTYELITWSDMYTNLVKVLWSEKEAKEFSENIDDVVGKYLDQELEGFSDTIKNSMNIGIQFAMMETLIQQWAKWSTEFFESFASAKSTDKNTSIGTAKTFEWLYTAFATFGSTNKFFTLANKVQNISWFLADNKHIITEYTNIPKLMNPYKFKELLTKPETARSDQKILDTLDIKTILDLGSTDWLVLNDEEKAKLKEIVTNKTTGATTINWEILITETSVASIQKSLKTADNLLDKREKINDNVTWFIDKLTPLLDLKIPLLWDLGTLIWVDFPTDILGKNKEWGVVNFVLGVLGFRGWLSGLHRKYIQEHLDAMDIDDTFISAACTDFEKNADTTLTNELATSTWKICWLTTADTTLETVMKAKIPADYAGLKKSIVDNISEAKLNAAVVEQFAPEAIISEDDVIKVDTTKITDAHIDTYLKDIIPKIAESDFLASEKTDKNAFALAVIGGLVGDKYFIEWVNIWLLTAADFKTATDNPTSWDKFSYENIDETDPALVELAKWPNKNYSDTTKFVQYLHSLEWKNGLPYGIMLNLMKTESWWKLYKKDGVTIIWSSAGAQWLFQFMPATAKWYIVKLWYAESEYEKIFTNPIIWAKACAEFLKNRKDAWDDVVNTLAHYNAWPATIWGKKVTADTLSQLPKETQKYVLTIWYDMLEYSGKTTIITEAQKSDPSLISKDILQKFLTAVNTIAPADETLEGSESLTQNNYKEDTIFVWDSITVGYAANPWIPALADYRSLGTKMWGKWTGWMDEHFSEATDATPTPKSIVVLGWVNDLCKFSLTNITSPASKKTAQEMSDVIIKNLQSMSDKAEAKWIKFIIGTILPFDGFLEKQTYASQQTVVDNALKLVNDKIKTTWPDTYIDYYTAFNDSTKIWYLKSEYDGGDGIHLSTEWYKEMQKMAFKKWKEIHNSTEKLPAA